MHCYTYMLCSELSVSFLSFPSLLMAVLVTVIIVCVESVFTQGCSWDIDTNVCGICAKSLLYSLFHLSKYHKQCSHSQI